MLDSGRYFGLIYTKFATNLVFVNKQVKFVTQKIPKIFKLFYGGVSLKFSGFRRLSGLFFPLSILCFIKGIG